MKKDELGINFKGSKKWSGKYFSKNDICKATLISRLMVGPTGVDPMAIKIFAM